MARRLFPYSRFVGLDTVTSPTNMSERYFVEIEHAHVDFRGQIVKGPGLSNNSGSSAQTYNIKHYGADDLVVYRFSGSNITGETGTVTPAQTLFQSSTAAITPISLVNFDQKQFAFMQGHVPQFYNGTAFAAATTTNNNALGRYPDGGFAVNILNRLAVAGIPNKPTEIHISVQDSYQDWRTNTSGGTTPAATDGAIIDVKNQFSSNDTIQGLAVLEGDKLVVFGQNETLVYLADTNINQWQIARDFRVPIGLFGRNTAVNVGTDVFFCSRFGVHSLRRAASGLTLETIMLSREIQDKFQEAVQNVTTTGSHTEPHAVWDGDLGQYNVYFPRSNGTVFDRLTFTYEPGVGRGGFRSFAFTPGANETCASFFARPKTLPFSGNIALGVSALHVGKTNGFWAGQDLSAAVGMSVRTPLLSQQQPDKYKFYKRLIVRAVGTSSFYCSIFDENNNLLQSTRVKPETDGFAPQTGINGDQTRPIDIPIPHRAKAISIKFHSIGTDSNGNPIAAQSGPLRILDFGLVVDIK